MDLRLEQYRGGTFANDVAIAIGIERPGCAPWIVVVARRQRARCVEHRDNLGDDLAIRRDHEHRVDLSSLDHAQRLPERIEAGVAA